MTYAREYSNYIGMIWENNGLSGSNSDVVIANENSFDHAFIYPLKCKKKMKKKISSKHGTARLSARKRTHHIAADTEISLQVSRSEN